MSSNQHFILRQQNIQQLRQILTEIGHSNEFEHHHPFFQNNIQDFDYQKQLKSVIDSYAQELSKKKTMINNIISFSFQFLNYAEQKTFQLQTAVNKESELQAKISQLCKQNEQLISKLHQIQEETQNYKQKLEEAQTYISQISLQKSELQMLKMNQKQAKNLFYQIQYYGQSRSQKIMEKSDQNNSFKFLTLIKAKDDQIIYLETQIAKMQQQFIRLQKELQNFKNYNKIQQIYIQNKNVEQVDCLPQNSIMIEKSLLKVDSCSSFFQDSQNHSSQDDNKQFQNEEENTQNLSDDQNQKSQNQELYQRKNFIESSIIRKKHQRRSLKYQVFDFCQQTLKTFEPQNQKQQIYCTLQIKSTAVGTQPIEKVSKGIQVDSNPKIIRKNYKKSVELQKNSKKQKEVKQQIESQHKKQKGILKSIFDFAMEKGVRSRIKCKTSKNK